MAAPTIGIVITGDASDLIAAADGAQKKLAEMSGKTVQQLQKDQANILKDAKRNQWQQFQLFQQIQDVGLQIAGGQNPLLALAQQGSQLTAIYGSAGAALRALSGSLISFATSPVALAAAAIGGLGYAFVKGDQQSADFRKSLYLTGNAAGLTEDSFNSLVKTVSASTEQSSGKVRDFAQALVSSGRFGGAGLQQITTLAVNMASATGQSVDATVQSLVRMKEAPAQWAAEQNKQLHFLSDAQLQYITKLENWGQREKAVQEVRLALLDRFPKVVNQNFGYIEAALDTAGKKWNSFWDSVYAVGRQKTPEDHLAALKKRLDEVNALSPRDVKNPFGPTQGMIDKQRADLMSQISPAEDAAALQNEVARLAAKRAQNQELQTENRLYAERLASQRESLSLAKLAAAAQKDVRTIEIDLLKLKQEAAAFEAPEIQAYYAKQIAEKELLKLASDRKQILKEISINAARPENSESDSISKQIKSIALKGQLEGNANEIYRRQIDLQSELGNLRQKQILQNYELQKQREDELQSIADLKRDAMIQANELKDQYKASQFANPENGRYFLESQRIKRESAAASARIGVLVDKTLDEKVQMIKESDEIFSQKQAAADQIHLDNLAKQENAQRGVNDAIKEYQENSKQAGIAAHNAVSMVINDLEDTLTNAVLKGKLDFTSLTDHIIAEVVRMKIVKPIIGNLLDFGGGGGGNFLSSLFGSANGNAFGPSGVIPFAKGGVVTRPTIFPFAKGTGLMGEAGPEAIMPLGRDNQGRLGVRGGGGNVQVNIINNAGAQVTQKQRQEGDTTFIDVWVNQIEDRIAGNIAAGAGSAYHSIRNTFGVNRAVS